MMEPPKSSISEENGDEMKSVPLDPDPKEPVPKSRPDLDPKPDGGASKPAGNGEIDTRVIIGDADLKEKSGGAEESSVDSAAEGSRAKKSVRWSEELVVESPVPRNSDRGSSNPYVNYSPAQDADSSSFNLKGLELMCAS